MYVTRTTFHVPRAGHGIVQMAFATRNSTGYLHGIDNEWEASADRLVLIIYWRDRAQLEEVREKVRASWRVEEPWADVIERARRHAAYVEAKRAQDRPG